MLQNGLKLGPNYVASYKGLQDAAVHSGVTARRTGANPFSFNSDGRNWVLLNALHNTRTHSFTSQSKDEAIMVKCLA